MLSNSTIVFFFDILDRSKYSIDLKVLLTGQKKTQKQKRNQNLKSVSSTL